MEKEIIEYPLLTVKNVVVFPETVRPLYFTQAQSLRALEEAVKSKSKVIVVTLKNPDSVRLSQDDIHEVGVIGKIERLQQLPNGAIQAVFEAEDRGLVHNTDLDGSFFKARVSLLQSRESAASELPQLVNALKTEFFKYLEGEKDAPAFSLGSQLNEDLLPAGKFADAVASYIDASLAEQQSVLSMLDTRERVEAVYELLIKVKQQRDYEKELKSRIEDKIGKRQKEFYLNEQMKAIQEEMGEESEGGEFEELKQKIEASGMPKKVREVADKELKKLKMMGNQSYEATPIRNYLDWLTSVPWKANTTDNLSIDNVQSILDEDHYGMEKVKERIVEHIAVANVVGGLKGPILCLSGPPGVGKTSLAQSVAKAVGREFARISLGGIRDEAEIRGHRRTYIGAMPGKIVQTMKKVSTTNPVILLDEIDKISQYYMGGPTAAMLEVLDPEQNDKFMDHYLEVEYDLSQVLFICTANNLEDIPLPLRDRMEIIHLSGYTELEKLEIAKKYLVPKQMKKNGLKTEQIEMDSNRIMDVIRGYTREAGVRSLERTLAKVCRKAVTEILKEKHEEAIPLDADRLQDYLGSAPFEHDGAGEKAEVGQITGLAWTSVGGETLSIEVTTMKGQGKIQLTGKLGDVMKESAQAALSYVRSHANSLGIYSKVFDNLDIHIHIPAGGTPKDGPSAGIALTTALVSALTGIPIDHKVALTGEVTLLGKVLPIGGLKEKLLAAKRAQIEKVLIPEKNQKDLAEIPDEITDGLKIVTAQHVETVFPELLARIPIPVKDDDLPESKASGTKSKSNFGLNPFSDMDESHPNVIEH